MQSYIFNKKYLNDRLERWDISEVEDIEKKHKIIKNWNYSLTESNLEKTKEVSLQGTFLTQIFTTVLGYKSQIGTDLWNLQQEQKTDFDSTTADGSLGFFTKDIKDVRAIIELKDAKTDLDKKQNRTNNQSPVDQAFSYRRRMNRCRWVIVSNIKEIRLYNWETMVAYESFTMAEMANDINEFKRFMYLMRQEFLLNHDGKSELDLFYENNEKEEEKITNDFYQKYKNIRTELYLHVREKNPEIDELIVLEKIQKLLDRFIFICFCEDTELLEENIFRKVLNAANETFTFAENRIWTQLKGLFHSIDKGNPHHNINRFNGGLFETDPVLDSFFIDDKIFGLFEEITKYDFGSELSVNILGHVFEQSISDIEEFKAEILGDTFDKNDGKRKRDGIFYTPEYVTDFIVNETITKWLKDRKIELGQNNLPELVEYREDMKPQEKAALTRARNRHIKFWVDYNEVLKNIKVIDPACGSGAFLVQAFEFLYKEGQRVNDELSKLESGQYTLFDLDKHILKNNLFGIDINTESVEITKLSLWLKTANKNDPLTTLDDNIRCGDSLVDAIFLENSFDIVLGNPPYVRQEKLGNLKKYFEDNYKVYHFGSDLFAYFYEKSLLLLKENGYLGFISNVFSKTNASKNLRKYIKHNTSIMEYVDFSSVQIFDGATTYPVVLVLKNEAKSSKFNYYKVTSEALSGLSYHKNLNAVKIVQESLDDSNWDFVSEEERTLKDKLSSLPDLKSTLGKSYRGLLTGLNPAFIIDNELYHKIKTDNPAATKHLVPFLEGRDLNKWHSNGVGKWLIFIRRGWTKETLGENVSEEFAKEYLKKNFKVMFAHLEKFEERAKKRHDKGEFWWELRSCGYTEVFEGRKIVWPNLQNAPKFSYDENSFYLNAPSVMIPAENKSLVAILNSKLIWYVLRSLCVVRNGGYIEVKPQFIERIPLPQKFNSPELDKVAEVLINQTKEIHRVQSKFLGFLQKTYELDRVSNKMNAFYELNFKEFTLELKKQKITLTNRQSYELIDIFEQESEYILNRFAMINAEERKLNALVYNIYGINEKEIKIIEESLKN